MNYMWKFLSNFKEFYNEINSATLTGAIDVIVIQQEDGTYLSSPFHVRFGKIGVLRSREKVVDIEINGEPVGIHMKLGETGEAFFVEGTDDKAEVPSHLATSPIPDISEFDKGMAILRSGGHKAEDDTFTVQIVNSNYSKETVKVCPYLEDSTAVDIGRNQDTTEHNKLAKDTVDCSDVKLGMEKHSGLSSTSQSKLFSNSEVTSSTQNDLSANDSGVVETDSNPSAPKPKKKRRKRTLKRRSVTKMSDPVDQAGPETVGVDNSEDTGEDIFQMDIEDDAESAFKQVVIPPTPSPSQVPQLSSQMRTEIQDHLGKESDWIANLAYNSLKLPRDGECANAAYSDGEVTPVDGNSSPSGSRPSTPKSDTEYEMRKMELTVNSADSQNQWSWTWGELPVPPQASPQVEHEEPFSDDDTSAKAKQIKKDQEEQRSMFGGMFKLMGMSKNHGTTITTEGQGMYLEDLSSSNLDPEVAALYLSTNSKWSSQVKGKDQSVIAAKDDDTESGHGSSLPQSPHSVDGAIGGPQQICLDSDSEETIANSELKECHDVAFSLCGNVVQCSAEEAYRQFDKSVITYEQFCSDPNVLTHPDLTVRINGKYCNWATAAPILMSLVLFQKPLPDTIVKDLMKEQSPKTTTKSQRRGYSWFSWRRTTVSGNEQAVSSSSAASSKHDDSSDDSTTKTQQPVMSSSITKALDIPTAALVENSDQLKREYMESSLEVALEKKISSSVETFKKSLRLSSEQISQLNLKDGPNEVVFSVTTAYQGTTRCKCHIYLWRYDDQIVVSDIDGTITKSDVLGHILPIVGKSWAQSGVAQLFTNIKRNGYHFLYLSARAIGQARITRDYLRSIKQGDITLPDGPLLLSPSSLISALHREVIEKKPEEFKISCLRDIQALFQNRNPFYAGYGNKINDVWAYRAMGIPMSRIFTINHRGELKHELNRTFQSSYSSLSAMVDHLFPPLRYSDGCDGSLTTDFVGAEEFSSFTYWREPLPDVEITLESQSGTEANTSKK